MYPDLSAASSAFMWIIGAYSVHKLHAVLEHLHPVTIGSYGVSSATLDRMRTPGRARYYAQPDRPLAKCTCITTTSPHNNVMGSSQMWGHKRGIAYN